MIDDEVPRQLSERTGKHYCTACLKETASEEFLYYDHLCRECWEHAHDYPFASTPGNELTGAGGDER